MVQILVGSIYGTIPGVKTINKIIVKTKIPLEFRKLAPKDIECERDIFFLKGYFYPKICYKIENNPQLQEMRSKTITIVFWDIRGFSNLCEVLKDRPFLILEFLKAYDEESSKAIFNHKGILDKFMGDKTMSLFGVFDNDDKKSAISAVNAAIKMQKGFDNLKKKYVNDWQNCTPHKIKIGLGCGVHTGEILVGNMGTEERDDFTAIGAHVNFARRIEKGAKDKQILVSATTKQRIQKACKVKKVDTWDDIKNISGEFDIFEVVHCRDTD